jgi:hypothetical protein
MRRTTITVDEPILEQLQRMAAERKVSIASIVREALHEKVATYQPRPRSLGMGASGHHDTGRRSVDERPEPRSWR